MEFVEFSAFARDAGVYGGARSPIDHALLTECFAEACEIPVTNVVEAHMALPQFLSAPLFGSPKSSSTFGAHRVASARGTAGADGDR